MAKDLLTLRFEGAPLVQRSLPIYSLGTSFIAVQRLIHKAALFNQARLEKGAHLAAREREEIALQVGAHRKGSDAWVFEPFLTNPAYGPILQGLVVAAVFAVAVYVKKKVLPGKQTPPNQTLVVNIFPEVRALTDRIDNIGSVRRIDLIPHKGAEPLALSHETKEYVREIQHHLVPGLPTEIVGRVTRLHPQSFRFDLEDSPKHYIHVRIAEELFEKIRRLPILQGRRIKIKGVPMYRLGNKADIEEFHAEKVVLLRERQLKLRD
jgi:hypothetical protein